MPINGFNKTTLLDYPGKIAATIFLGSCNFRCPFCHNSGLVLSPGEQPVIPTEDVLKVLARAFWRGSASQEENPPWTKISSAL